MEDFLIQGMTWVLGSRMGVTLNTGEKVKWPRA